MKTKLKKLTPLLCGVLAVFLLAACGEDDFDNEDTVEVCVYNAENTMHIVHVDAAELLVGTWETQLVYPFSWNDRIEFFADGTGRILQFRRYEDIEERNEWHFAWSITDNSVTFLYDTDSGFYRRFRFAIFRDVFGSREILQLSEQITDWINGWPDEVVTLERRG